MTARLNSRVMLLVCLGLGWSGEGWAEKCYFDCDWDDYVSSIGVDITLKTTETCDSGPIRTGACGSSTSIAKSGTSTEPSGVTADCNDNDDAIKPGADDDCDEIDNDCDDSTDEGAVGTAPYCKDEDDDNYYSGSCGTICLSDSTKDYSAYKAQATFGLSSGDCKDDSSAYNPGVLEGLLAPDDLNCNKSCEYYADDDGDGIGDDISCSVAISKEGDPCPGVDTDYPTMASTMSCVRVDGTTAISAYMGNICEGLSCAKKYDCEPNNPDVFPGKKSETCESVSQVEEDCNDDQHTYLDSSGMAQPASGSQSYYADKDGDTFGDALESKYLCLPDKIASITYVSDKTDCNDMESLIHPGATEVCNASYGDGRGDEDCDGLNDEVRKASGMDIEAANCTIAYIDADKDGDGDLADTKSPVCVCESKIPSLGDPSSANPSPEWLSLEACKQYFGEYSEFCLTMDYCVYGFDEYEAKCCSHSFDSSSTSCTSWVEDKELNELRDVFGVTANGYVLLSSTNQDCNDADPLIRYSYNTPEVLDGRDSDCSGYMPAVEFDCDGDLYVVGEYGSNFLSDDACEEGDLRDLKCSGYTIQTECRLQRTSPTTEVLQWQIRLLDVPTFVDVRATKRSPTVLDGLDCDDSCASRYPGREESCDGLDNDCSLTRSEDCTLDKALHGECAGTVCEDEADPDGDGAISCNANAEMVCARTVQTSLQCDGTTDIFRGDPSAYCTRATPYRESDDVDGSGLGVDDRCDGVNAAPRGLPYEGERDADRDRHYACGPHHNLSGDEVGGPESVFVLVYFADDAGYPGGVNAVPLIYPRAAPGGGVLPSDVGLATRLLEDLDKLDWSPVSIGEPNPLTPIIQGQKVVVGSDAEAEAPSVNQAGEYAGLDPLLDLCIRAELCATQKVGKAPEWCAAGRSKEGISGRCAVVEMKLNEASGLVYEPPVGADTGDFAGGGSPVDSASEDVFVGAPIAGELAGRLVWPQARIVESRRRVVEWDCFLTLGTYGCGALAEESLGSPGLTSAQLRRFTPSTLGAGRIFSAPLDAVMTDTRWWKELGRYYDGSDDPEVATVVTETLLSCWGDPTVNPDLTRSVHGRVGGDCRDEDSSDEAPTHRDALEGPYDVLGGLTGEQADCDTCVDGLDNNCDGLLDCEDPGCAPCFVGQGIASGCAGADPESPCASSGGCSAGRGARSPWTGLGELGMLLLAALAVPLWRRGVK